ncbi:kinase-like domain-containing protein [Mycena floridula]|nr:kinase-like domain-containing protein [Mycena floridula]
MAHSMKCLRHLRRLAAQKGILPPSFFLHNVVRDGPHPVFGGGFADVYKGKLNGEVVCLKALRFFVERPEMARKLLNDCCREALVWNQLDHPNVLPFLGVNVDLFAPSFCLVSPWMSNGNLMQYLQRNPDFERRNAIIDIAAAMKYLHEYSPPIVHADIRGANVLVRDDLRCCLADFGLSSITTSFTLTSSSGNGAGSVRWLAPELFLMSEEDKSCMKSTSRDIYAFACTILEVYTGQPPFSQHKFDPPVMYDVLAGRRPSRPLALPNDLWTLVESCWQHDPALRPSAQAVMRDLRIDSVDLSSTVSSVNPAPASVALLLPPGPKGSMDEKNNPKPTSPSSTMKSSHTEPGPFNFKDINYVEELVHLSASQTDLSLDEDKENISFPFNVGDRDRRVTNGWQDEQDIDDDATFYATNSKLYISPARRQTSTRLSGNSDLFSPSSSNSSYINLDLR